jgi:LysM repeat protein
MERKVILLKKKDIAMICFVIIITCISLWAIWQSSGGMSNSSGSSENKNSSTSIDNTTKGPTIIDNSLKEQKNNSSTTDNSSDSNKSTVDNTDSDENSSKNSSSLDSSDSFTLYKVEQGETLKDICESYSDSCPEAILSKAILSANNLSKASEITANLEIKIPDKYINGSKYTVKSGDSLYKIASEYSADSDVTKAIQEIKKDNFLSNDNIRLGQELFISANLINNEDIVQNEQEENSDSDITSETEEENDDSTATTSANVSNEDLVNYEVQEGESLAAISKRYEKYCPAHIATKTILKLNNLEDSKDVKAGTEIKIPAKYLTHGENYEIKSGDTLSSIAEDFFSDLSLNEAIEKIKSDNFMSSYDIKLGDHIFLSETSLEFTSAD